MTAKEYADFRLSGQKKYYSNKSKKNKKLFYFLSYVQIFISAVISFLTLFMDFSTIVKFVIAGLGVISTFTTSIMLLLRPQENWISSRTTLENLKAEEIYFKAEITPYDNQISDAKRNALYIQRCENIMGTEHTTWKDNAEKAKV